MTRFMRTRAWKDMLILLVIALLVLGAVYGWGMGW